MTNETTIKLNRRAPGYYMTADGRIEIIHCISEETGSSIGWIFKIDDEPAGDYFYAKWEAKEAAERWIAQFGYRHFDHKGNLRDNRLTED